MRVVVAGLRPALDSLAEALGAELDAAGRIVLIHIVSDEASDAAYGLVVSRDDVEVVHLAPGSEVIITAWRVAAERPDVAILCRPPRWRHPLSAQVSAIPGIRLVDVPSTLP